MDGVLQVVCTPIGNLGDLSPRAREALTKAQVILAEDTRKTRPLLAHFGIESPMLSCHQHNEKQRAQTVLEHLFEGRSVALVSDAGAPAISDPGGRLVDAVQKAGGRIEVIPGPSAVVAALMGAGLIAHRFAFLGFLPKRGQERRRIVESAAKAGLALVLYEAANRAPATLSDLAAMLGPRRVVVARELTKRFETFHRGRLGESLSPPLVQKGEMVIVVEAAEPTLDAADPDTVQALLEDPTQPKKARAKALAKLLGISARDAYAQIQAKADAAAAGQPQTATLGAKAEAAGDAPHSHPHPSANSSSAEEKSDERVVSEENSVGCVVSEEGSEPRRRVPVPAASVAAFGDVDGAVEGLADVLCEAARAFIELEQVAKGVGEPSDLEGSRDGFEKTPAAEGAPAEHIESERGAGHPIAQSGLRGADALIAWLTGPTHLKAPVEARTLGQTLLSALSEFGDLKEALAMAEEVSRALAGRYRLGKASDIEDDEGG